jgi:hypothetical protein
MDAVQYGDICTLRARPTEVAILRIIGVFELKNCVVYSKPIDVM